MFKKYKKWFIASSILVIVLIFWLVVKGGAPTDEYTTVSVNAGTLIQTVSEVGIVKPVQEVSLNFLNTGRISDIFVKVGDTVSKDTPLISLDMASLELKKLEAEAGHNIAQANLSKIIAGASREAVNVSQSEIEQAIASEKSAQADLSQIKKTVAENIKQAENSLFELESDSVETQTAQEQAVSSAAVALENAEKSGQTAIDNSRSSVLLVLDDKILTGEVALDNLKTILEDDDAENVLGVKNTVTLTNTKSSRLAALNLLPNLKEAVLKAKSTKEKTDINLAGTLAKDFLSKTSQSLNQAYSMLEATIVSSNFTQTKLDSYKSLVTSQNTQVSTAASTVENSLQTYNTASLSYTTSIASAQQNLNQAQVNLSNAISAAQNNLNNIILSGNQQAINAQARLDSAVNSVSLARARLSSVVAPARSQDLALAQAQINQAKAALDNIINQIENSVIKAPLNGVITEINFNIGEQAGASIDPAVKMLAEGNFEIEVDISESDINKIVKGDKVDITLDAFPDELIIPGSVSFIEPAQTLIQGVVYYKVKIAFDINESIVSNLNSQGLSLKSGMTANVVITTDRKDEVLSIPARAIIDRDGNKFVRILVDGKMQENLVTAGIRGDDGLVEIEEGLMAGDEVITFIKSAK
ncbi:MAG TPA: HlyD family efflux transporter periplasmic adaptor subunit [Patescibacteria group bacterium]|nr:HlyD family efflux transporter periplasmic adaptor subunit [Patescibacteria group bacterium]